LTEIHIVDMHVYARLWNFSTRINVDVAGKLTLIEDKG